MNKLRSLTLCVLGVCLFSFPASAGWLDCTKLISKETLKKSGVKGVTSIVKMDVTPPRRNRRIFCTITLQHGRQARLYAYRYRTIDGAMKYMRKEKVNSNKIPEAFLRSNKVKRLGEEMYVRWEVTIVRFRNFILQVQALKGSIGKRKDLEYRILNAVLVGIARKPNV